MDLALYNRGSLCLEVFPLPPPTLLPSLRALALPGAAPAQPFLPQAMAMLTPSLAADAAGPIEGAIKGGAQDCPIKYRMPS